MISFKTPVPSGVVMVILPAQFLLKENQLKMDLSNSDLQFKH